ncbi:MAG: hypothetical protein ACRC0X_07225 [Brevinema sp.]
MKLLIVMFMLLSACIQKEESVEREIEIVVEEKPSLFDANYDGGEELILTERRGFVVKYRYKEPYDLTVPLYAIYWNSNNNQYYYVKDGSDLMKTNGLTYKLDPKKVEEQVFVPDMKDPYLQYAGYISPAQRLYIDRRDQQQYIKELISIYDPIEVIPYKNAFAKDGSFSSRKKFGDPLDKDKEKFVGSTWYCDPIYKEGFQRSSRTGNLPFGELPF